MSEDQITAIAREYAEEIYPNLSDKIISLRTLEIKNAERLIRFLLRRFCLVEKSRIQEEYQKAKTQIKDGKELGLHVLVTLGGAKEALLESLFPSIAKEVEE